ncbi:hypothetical protein APUTEX25_004775, partial [Auxenochlorella protothecoides]
HGADARAVVRDLAQPVQAQLAAVVLVVVLDLGQSLGRHRAAQRGPVAAPALEGRVERYDVWARLPLLDAAA